mmetsp:Transcript_6753/g.14636  ORF Transcript_6753/g.14636 Transcript_6753/m.14636 type:complete len:273 (-) Transcript_6753:137-955(-)
MTTATTNNPSFEPPTHDDDDSDNEIWLLRAPAHLDVSELLTGVTLAFNDPSTHHQPSSNNGSTSNNILSTFQSGDGGEEYSLTLVDGNESENTMRLLVPDKSGNELIPYHRPFQRQIQLTSSCHVVVGGGSGSKTNINSSTGLDNGIQADLLIAPARETAPSPATNASGNGSVDAMRLAYVPVPQRQGLKRRWAMPGSMIRNAFPSALYDISDRKKARVDDGAGGEVVGTPQKKVVCEDEEAQGGKVVKSSSKKDRKEKKKKDKKSKKSSKK